MKSGLIIIWIFILTLLSFSLSGADGNAQPPTASPLSAEGQAGKANEAPVTEQMLPQAHQNDITIKPVAVPVVSPEEANEANKNALKDYNSRKTWTLLKNLLLIAISAICIAVLIFSLPFKSLKHIRFLQVWDFAGWVVISFVVMYCVLLIFQINRPGYEFLTSLQPILTSSSLHLLLGTFLLFLIVYVKLILPFLLKCKLYKLFIIELLFALFVGGFVIFHFKIEPTNDFLSLSTYAKQWQNLPQDEIEKLLSSQTLTGVLRRRCYYSYYLLYNMFGCNYIVIEIAQLFMHLALGINVFFLAKQCVLREKIARLSMILYYFMPVQYLYLTIPSLDLWGGMFLCFNANLIIYLFRKSSNLQFYKRVSSDDLLLDSKTGFMRRHTIQRLFVSFTTFFKRIPWLIPLLFSILLGITLFWMEMVRNLMLILCIPMFLFLSAVLVQQILDKKIKLFSRTMLFICILCLLFPFLSNKMMQKICNVTPYGSEGIPGATAQFNSPDEIREVVRFGDYHMLSAERRKDFALDAATSYWRLYPSKYAHYFGTKIGRFSDLFNPEFVATSQSIRDYPHEFAVYSFLVWIVKIIFVPLLLIGILCNLFFKRWNSFVFVPIVMFFFFFILMPTVGECQVRYTSLYYGPMCVCASCTLLISQKGHYFFRKKAILSRFIYSILVGFACIAVLLFGVTSLFSNLSFSEEHQFINFHENLWTISSGDLPNAYKEHSEGQYLLSCVFRPEVTGVIPKKTYVEWRIPELTTEGLEYMLYGYLIAPLKDNADFIIKINDIQVWDNSAFAKSGNVYSNIKLNIEKEKIIFLDKLKFTAKKENILRVEITPKNKNNIDFALSAWGMVPSR